MAVPVLTIATDFVPIPVIAPTINGTRADPTGLAVYMALMSTTADPGDSDWMPAEWQAIDNQPFVACCLIGPGGGHMTLTPGVYYWPYVKIVGSPQVLVLASPMQLVGV